MPCSSSILGSDKIAIEISSGKTKTATFLIECSNPILAHKIKTKLEFTRRFKQITCANHQMEKMQAAGIDMFIKVIMVAQSSTLGSGPVIKQNNIQVEIYDVIQKKLMKTITISHTTNIADTINEIANRIYSAWITEPGIFNTSIVAINDIGQDLSTLVEIPYTHTSITCISPPVSYLSTILNVKNEIYLTKFCVKKRGLAIFSYRKASKQFFRVLSIEYGSVFSPAIYNDMLYVSGSFKGTTGIYSLPSGNECKQFKNFQEFECSKNTRNIVKIPSKIATSININSQLVIFCSNMHGRPAIFKHIRDASASSVDCNTQISQNTSAAYYDPALFENIKVAAIKSMDGQFHLVIIDLATNSERTLLSKYYISKPAWSPCGNWLAVSAREKGENDVIVIIHKSGKYQQVISAPTSLRSPVWIERSINNRSGDKKEMRENQ